MDKGNSVAMLPASPNFDCRLRLRFGFPGGALKVGFSRAISILESLLIVQTADSPLAIRGTLALRVPRRGFGAQIAHGVGIAGSLVICAVWLPAPSQPVATCMRVAHIGVPAHAFVDRADVAFDPRALLLGWGPLRSRCTSPEEITLRLTQLDARRDQYPVQEPSDSSKPRPPLTLPLPPPLTRADVVDWPFATGPVRAPHGAARMRAPHSIGVEGAVSWQ